MWIKAENFLLNLDTCNRIHFKSINGNGDIPAVLQLVAHGHGGEQVLTQTQIDKENPDAAYDLLAGPLQQIMDALASGQSLFVLSEGAFRQKKARVLSPNLPTGNATL